MRGSVTARSPTSPPSSRQTELTAIQCLRGHPCLILSRSESFSAGRHCIYKVQIIGQWFDSFDLRIAAMLMPLSVWILISGLDDLLILGLRRISLVLPSILNKSATGGCHPRQSAWKRSRRGRSPSSCRCGTNMRVIGKNDRAQLFAPLFNIATIDFFVGGIPER